MVMTRKFFALMVVTFLIFLSAYWLKSLWGLNIFNDFSLSRYPMFAALNAQVINNQPFPGPIVADSFDEKGLLISLKSQWKFYGSAIDMTTDSHTRSNNMMIIRTTTTERWNGNLTRYVQVQTDEHYQYSIRVKMTGAASFTGASVITYDANRKALSWSNFKTRVVERNTWLELQRKFSVPAGVHYIKFRIIGAGIGEYRFDDFLLKKLPAPSTH